MREIGVQRFCDRYAQSSGAYSFSVRCGKSPQNAVSASSDKTPSRSARETRSDIDLAPSFSKMCLRCSLIVRSAMPSAWAACLFNFPQRQTQTPAAPGRQGIGSMRASLNRSVFASSAFRRSIARSTLSVAPAGIRVYQRNPRRQLYRAYCRREVPVSRGNTTGSEQSSSARRRCRSGPLKPGIRTSSKMQPDPPPSPTASKKRSADSYSAIS